MIFGQAEAWNGYKILVFASQSPRGYHRREREREKGVVGFLEKTNGISTKRRINTTSEIKPSQPESQNQLKSHHSPMSELRQNIKELSP